MKPIIAIVVIIIPLLLASQTITGQISTLRLVGNQGRVEVEGVGVYFDLNCTKPIDYINWGSLGPASTRNQTIFVRNEGNIPAFFFLATSDWNPANLTQYIHLTWNYKQQTTYPYQTIQITLTLTTSQSTEFQNYITNNKTNQFNFSITIGINK